MLLPRRRVRFCIISTVWSPERTTRRQNGVVRGGVAGTDTDDSEGREQDEGARAAAERRWRPSARGNFP